VPRAILPTGIQIRGDRVIAQLRGKILETRIDKDVLRAVIDVNGVGYEVLMTLSSDGRVRAGETCALFISESVTAFDGATTLYGFATREEKDFFLRIRENVDGVGPKKALEYLEKISKSLPDFKRAIIDSDNGLLVSVFGFTKKTAEKLIFALKGKVDSWGISGSPKWQEAPRVGEEAEAVSGLVNMGYREDEAREATQRAKNKLGENASTPQILKEALRLIGSRL
jgi:Holliday junction DNA helicase RuvA